MKNLNKILSYILVAALASVATLGVQFYNRGAEVSKLDQLESLILERFIGEADQTEMEDSAAYAMIDSLGDRWSYYIPAASYQAHVEQMENAYVGVGITIMAREDGTGFDVMKVDAGGPAEEAGMVAGDVIVAAEGERMEGKTTDDLRSLVRGKAGTEVRITVLRDGREIELTMTRREIQTPVATAQMLAHRIGLVTIYNFDSRCADETIASIEELLQEGATSLIFDVRNNGGGYKDELVKVLDYLLPEGPLFRSEDYKGNVTVDESDADCLEIPMAVLVNGESYSAAEFFAAALSEYEAAVVVGEKTSGKGYFQTTILLNDGSAVGLSVGKYTTPNGVSLADVGITPDIQVDVDEETFLEIYSGTLAPEEDPQIQAAVDALS